MNLTNQLHDFNPGFGPAVSPDGSNGFGTRVFWTAAIPARDVTIDPEDGKVELRVTDLPVYDYPDVNTSIGPDWQTAFDKATVSFDVVWQGPVTRQVDVKDAANGFAGRFFEDQATLTWSARSDSGFRFKADPSSSTSLFAELGFERNGIFFPQAKAAASPQSATHTSPAEAGVRQANLLSPVGFEGPAGLPAGQDWGQQSGATLAQSGLTTDAVHQQALDAVFSGMDGSRLAKVLNGKGVDAWSA